MLSLSKKLGDVCISTQLIVNQLLCSMLVKKKYTDIILIYAINFTHNPADIVNIAIEILHGNVNGLFFYQTLPPTIYIWTQIKSGLRDKLFVTIIIII